MHRCASEGTPFSILTLLLARRLRHIAGDVAYLDELRTALDGLHAAAATAGARPPARPARATSGTLGEQRIPRARAAASPPTRLR